MSRRSVTASALAIAATAALPGAAAGQSEAPYTGGRPHAAVTLREANEIAPERLEAAVRVREGRAVVDVTVAGRHAGTNGAIRGELRVSRCGDERRVVLRCVTVARTRIALGRVGQRVRFRIRRPASGGAIQVTLNRPGSASSILAREPASLILPDEAWRGRAAGATFGGRLLRAGAVRGRFLRFDAVGISDARVRPTIRWTALSSAPATVTWRCTGAPSCDDAVREQPLTAGTPFTEQRRPGLTGAGATVGVLGVVGDDVLFSARVPRPLR